MYCEIMNKEGEIDGIICRKDDDYCSSDEWCNGNYNVIRSFWSNHTDLADPGCHSKGTT